MTPRIGRNIPSVHPTIVPSAFGLDAWSHQAVPLGSSALLAHNRRAHQAASDHPSDTYPVNYGRQIIPSTRSSGIIAPDDSGNHWPSLHEAEAHTQRLRARSTQRPALTQAEMVHQAQIQLHILAEHRLREQQYHSQFGSMYSSDFRRAETPTLAPGDWGES